MQIKGAEASAKPGAINDCSGIIFEPRQPVLPAGPLRLRQAAMAAKQYSPAVSALREKAILAGLRVERKESGDAGAFANLTEAELDQMLADEYAKLKAIQDPASDDDAADSAKPN